MWAERGIRAWVEGWWASPMRVGDQIGRIVGAPAGIDGDAPERGDCRGDRALVLPAGRSRAKPRRLRARELPVGALPLPGPARPRGRRLRGRRGDRDADRRAHPPRADQPRAVQGVARSRTSTPIVRRAHEVGAYVVLDCYQSAGIVPVDVTALGVDFAVGGSVKWLCGGPANGWLYVRPDLAERLEPTSTGWQAHERPFAFEEEMEYASGSARFLTGTPNARVAHGGDGRLRPDRGDRRRADPRELAPSDRVAHRPCRRGRLRRAKPARAGAARRNGDD